MIEEEKVMVSVCIVTYKHEAYIKEAIEGVLNQEVDFKVNLLIGDDCSPDNTSAIVEEMMANHPNGHWITYIKRKENIGMMPNFIDLLERCSGKYIALCDGDDYWTDPLKLQQQVDFLENNSEYVISFHKSVNYDLKHLKNERVFYGDLKSDKTVDQKWLAAGIYIPTATSCFKNNFTLPDNFNKVKNADTFLWSILGHQGKAIFQHDINPSVRRVHQGGVFSMKDDVYRFQQMLHSYKQMLSVTDDRYKTYLKTKICKTYIMLSKAYLKKYNLGKSIPNFLQSLSFLQLNQYGLKSFLKVLIS
ncbi:Glycosyltransferase involved in cell wall bisynthesis [Marivirga sericea]|uniref:Glycosyltransferase involved in cell wall bisynthesis n=1 Tax=Marivirga sericea TaxID=1028 RepID=A0A1X7IK53_9BACT|nr:glycosyltransferase family 2 protein [Marivirga sericea]SMG15117.1 Glycosyltransferase involved in cell wall bisynthesis [Marivirga sericea]